MTVLFGLNKQHHEGLQIAPSPVPFSPSVLMKRQPVCVPGPPDLQMRRSEDVTDERDVIQQIARVMSGTL